MRKSVLLIMLYLLTLMPTVFAQSFQIQITPEAGFDVVDSIYNEFQQQQPQSTLTVLNQNMPLDIDYLISRRPFGDLLQLMIDNPDWNAAQLARRLIITYPYPVDVTDVMESFQNHSSIELVSYDYALDPIEFSPEIPFDNQNISVDLAFLAGNCETPDINPQGLSYDVSVNGSQMNLDIVVEQFFSVIPTLCLINDPPFYTYQLGTLPAGNYSLNINTVYNFSTFPISENERNYLGTISFSVFGSQTRQVPFLSWWSIALLLVALFFSLGFKIANARQP